MAHTTTSMEIFGSPEQVWQLIGGFNSLPDWLPYIPSSKLTEGGRVRHLANPDGDTIIERLEVFNDKERYYTYSIMNAPFPVTNYLSTIQVKEGTESNTSVVEWSGTFTPVEVSDEEAINLFHGIYSDGLKALQQAFLD
ncbi:SRPBCC family protein [Bacillus cereus]|uniref:SRPBCC family protein n=1 Tax=Bacillus TaxID=1386 RepID=UPI000B450C1E|nr:MULTISPECIES: SRPBCC family protein [Bacillus]MBH0349699.1 XoxI [Bacillus thuringiensis]MDA1904956.1 SRPBCC family protein [Bacillus cereus]MDQ7235468.1 SRPBCC family protein [Bacillus pacificus]MDQ7240006.1 SRPBCC family protein [Bacillus pacificus]MED1303995.1 SRPBCC family protein [Bacillus pacificus]